MNLAAKKSSRLEDRVNQYNMKFSSPCLAATLTYVSISQQRNKSDNWLQVEKAKLCTLKRRCPLIDVYSSAHWKYA